MENHSSPPAANEEQTRPKRVITEARKLQNREAQRAYRQRQRERRQEQDKKRATLKPLQRSRLPELRALPQLLDEQLDVASQQSGADAEYQDVSSLNSPDELPFSSSLLSLSEVDTTFLADLDRAIAEAPDQTIPELEDTQSLLPANSQTNILLNPSLCRTQNENTLANPYPNTLQPTRTSLLKACMFNAESLGITIDEFFSYSCMSLCSPFYRPVSPSDDPHALLAAASRPSIPAHLQPTLPQILFPHHPLFDLIPIPTLRSRAIMLAAASPHVVNIVDLKLDIVEGGLVCWGRRRGGQPWDGSSWEAAPWFWEKWRLVVSGGLL